MEFRVTCECGKEHPVTAGGAGSKLACPCGRTVAVPSLGELRRRGLAPDATHPVLAVGRMIEAGELPPSGGCVRCGAPADRVAHVTAECERKWVRRQDEFHWYYIFMPWIILLAWALHREPAVKEFGRDV